MFGLCDVDVSGAKEKEVRDQRVADLQNRMGKVQDDLETAQRDSLVETKPPGLPEVREKTAVEKDIIKFTDTLTVITEKFNRAKKAAASVREGDQRVDVGAMFKVVTMLALITPKEVARLAYNVMDVEGQGKVYRTALRSLFESLHGRYGVYIL